MTRLRARLKAILTGMRQRLHAISSRLQDRDDDCATDPDADTRSQPLTRGGTADTTAASESSASESSTAEPSASAAPTASSPETPTLRKGSTPEEFVHKLLEANGGQLAWQALCEELGWSSQTSRTILNGMESAGQIVVQSEANGRKVAYLPQHAPEVSQAADAESTPFEEGLTKTDIVARTGLSPAAYICRGLNAHGGQMTQQELCAATGWSEATVSQTLSELEEAGEVIRIQVGRENLVCLPDAVPEHVSS